jgi:hypothetical protein
MLKIGQKEHYIATGLVDCVKSLLKTYDSDSDLAASGITSNALEGSFRPIINI